jgi:hypothetical protein
VHSVNYVAEAVHTIRALSGTITNSHQEPLSDHTCNSPDP